MLRTTPAEILTRIEALQDNLKKSERCAERSAEEARARAARPALPRPRPKRSTATPFVGRAVEGVAAKDLRGLVDAEKEGSARASSLSILKGEDGKGTAAIGVTDDLVGKYSAADLIKHATVALGGQGGGGRPDMAQGGGPDGSKADAAVAAVRSAL